MSNWFQSLRFQIRLVPLQHGMAGNLHGLNAMLGGGYGAAGFGGALGLPGAFNAAGMMGGFGGAKWSLSDRLMQQQQQQRFAQQQAEEEVGAPVHVDSTCLHILSPIRPPRVIRKFQLQKSC